MDQSDALEFPGFSFRGEDGSLKMSNATCAQNRIVRVFLFEKFGVVVVFSSASRS